MNERSMEKNSSEQDNLFASAAQTLIDANGIRHNCTQFFPHPYNFRIKDHNEDYVQMDAAQCLNARVRCPEFHIIFDHTLAVLWMCFSKQPGALSASQIQWAVKFLEGITNDQGEHSSDVRFAIARLNELTMKKYNLAPDSKIRPSTSEPNLSKMTMNSNSKNSISFTLNDMLQKFYPERLIQLLSFSSSRTNNSKPDMDTAQGIDNTQHHKDMDFLKNAHTDRMLNKNIIRLKSIDNMIAAMKADGVNDEEMKQMIRENELKISNAD